MGFVRGGVGGRGFAGNRGGAEVAEERGVFLRGRETCLGRWGDGDLCFFYKRKGGGGGLGWMETWLDDLAGGLIW